ncbi:MAG: class I SAM-dependent methyltransferase [Sandaracinaceae bacterium]
MVESVPYDDVAPTFDRRYDIETYGGVERALFALCAAPGARVLEVGCGTGHWLELLSLRGVSVAGLEPSRQMLARARDKGFDGELVEGVAEAIPWEDGSFDRVICINALHHFTDRAAFMSEAARVLRPNGVVWSVGLDPHTGLDRWFVYDLFEGARERDLTRYPSTPSIRAAMAAAGLRDAATEAVQRFPVWMPVTQLLAEGHADRHATSQLSLLTDDAYARGRAALERMAEDERASGAPTNIGADLTLYATSGRRRDDRAISRR